MPTPPAPVPIRAPILKQLVVLVSITSTPRGLDVGYIYTDPDSGDNHGPSSPSSSCVFKAISPFNTIYALDYKSTLDGWRFRRHVEPKAGSRRIPYQRAANRLSMTTKYRTIDTEYSFYLLFKNILTGKLHYDDPQEGNVPGPQSAGLLTAPTPTPTPHPKAEIPAAKKRKAKP